MFFLNGFLFEQQIQHLLREDEKDHLSFWRHCGVPYLFTYLFIYLSRNCTTIYCK